MGKLFMLQRINQWDQSYCTPRLEWPQNRGPTKNHGLDSLKAKFEAFKWEVLEMNGNDMDAVVAGLNNGQSFGEGRPS